MELGVRGFVEKAIDKLLTDYEMSAAHQYFETLKPFVKSREDAILGYVVGSVFAAWTSLNAAMVKEVTSQEVNEVFECIKRRTPEIRSRILQTLT